MTVNKRKLKIGFMGTPDFSVAPLKALVEAGYNIACVYSQPPRPKGRGHQIQPSPVHEYADSQGIPVFTPSTLRDKDIQQQFFAQELDLAVVVAYGLILPEPVLNSPKHGCVNIHASLLPRWRGASPIQQAIWADDKETGVSLMFMEKGLDTGPVIAEEKVLITADTTASRLHDQLSDLGARMIVDLVAKMSENPAVPSTPQDDELTTYAPLLKKEDGEVNWNLRAASIDCQVRALNPWPGVYTHMNGKRIKILRTAQTTLDHESPPGTALDRDGHIACGDGTVLRLLEIQPHGSRPMDFASAVNGNHVEVGSVFE